MAASGYWQPSGAPLPSGNSLHDFLKRGTPLAASEREALWQDYHEAAAPNSRLIFNMVSLYTLGDRDTWNRASAEERKLLDEEKAIDDLFSEVGSSIGRQSNAKHQAQTVELSGEELEKRGREMLTQWEALEQRHESGEIDAKKFRRLEDTLTRGISFEEQDLQINYPILSATPTRKICRRWQVYLSEQQAQAQAFLEQTEVPQQWWRERIAKIDETASALRLSLDPNDTQWAEASAAHHQASNDEVRDLKRRLARVTPPPTLENLFGTREFHGQYIQGGQKYTREEFDQIIDQLFPSPAAGGV